MTASARSPHRALAVHAARLLAGTGVSARDAVRAAAGDPHITIRPGAEAAVQALRDGWDAAGGGRIAGGGRAGMTAELYDLGMRLRAAAAAQPAARLSMAPLMPAAAPVAVRAVQRKDMVTAAAAVPGQAEQRAAGPAVLDMLHQMGVRITGESRKTLVTADHATLPALLALARAEGGPDGGRADTAAHIGWWADRADFPGSTGVVPLVRACRERWVTGTAPAGEASPRTWRAWLRVPGSGCTAMLGMLARVQAGVPLPLLSWTEEDTAESWQRAQAAWAARTDWRQPDSIARSAAGLRARNDAADLYAAALLRDPLYRRRAVHTGHVVTGTAHIPDPKEKTIIVTCDRPDGRLRETEDVTLWAGGLQARPEKVLRGTVTAAAITGRTLTLTLSCSSRGRPADGAAVTMHAADPIPSSMKSLRQRTDRLYRATSWLATGGKPVLARRDVPLGVMIAGAGD
jgi:hypothetical protein